MKMPGNVWHWSISDIDHSQVPAELAVGAGRFFLHLFWSLFFGRKYREKIVQHMLQAISFSLFPQLLH